VPLSSVRSKLGSSQRTFFFRPEGIRLLCAPRASAEEQAQQINHVFVEVGLPPTNGSSEIMSIIGELRRLSTQWNSNFFLNPLFCYASKSNTLEELKSYLLKEMRFYHGLYEPRQGDNFRIYPTDNLRFTYDDSSFPSIVFASNGLIYGCSDLEFLPNRLVINYIQGLSVFRSTEQRRTFGAVWFEIFMHRVLQAYRRFLEFGMPLMLRIEDPKPQLSVMVRDRYFKRTPSAYGILYELSYERKRVKEILKT